MRERRLLGCPGVAEERAGRAETEIPILDTVRCEVLRTEVLRERACRGGSIELPHWQRPGRNPVRLQPRRAVRNEKLGGIEALDQRCGFGRRHFGQRQPTRGEIEPRNAGSMLACVDGDKQAVALGIEEVGVGHRSRRHDAQYLALDRPFARRRIADLFADRDRLTELHQPREVAFDGVVGHARHRDRRAGGRAACSERDVEKLRRPLGVGVEELVEIAHPVEQQLVRMLCLGAQILLHHGRVLRLHAVIAAQFSACFTFSTKHAPPCDMAIPVRARGDQTLLNSSFAFVSVLISTSAMRIV